MNRIDICKNIIQSIKDYITTPEKLEPHRVKNHFVRKRKLSLFQVIMYPMPVSFSSLTPFSSKPAIPYNIRSSHFILLFRLALI